MASHVMFLVMGSVLLVVTLILHVISLALPYYAEAHNLGMYLSNKSDLTTYKAYYPNMDANYGFWKFCANFYADTACYYFGMEEDINSSTVKAPDWVIACQALSISGLAVGTLGVLFSFIWLCVSSTYLLVAASLSSICGGTIIIIANIVFATEKSVKFVFQSTEVANLFGKPEDKYLVATDNAFWYGWDFGLDIATGIMCILIGVLFAVCAAMSKKGKLYISKTVI